jgi:hypothetical protein
MNTGNANETQEREARAFEEARSSTPEHTGSENVFGRAARMEPAEDDPTPTRRRRPSETRTKALERWRTSSPWSMPVPTYPPKPRMALTSSRKKCALRRRTAIWAGPDETKQSLPEKG